MYKAHGYAAQSPTTPLAPFSFERRDPGGKDVQIKILFCGICHSDLHTARGEWKGTVYPCVPGHEIVGEVVKVGDQVKNFKAGDLAAVGCLVDSCRSCLSCAEGLQQYCENGPVYTYNGPDKHTGKVTYGGYSDQITVDENFVIAIPKEFTKSQLANVAPLLCAGITTYSPLRHWNVGKNSKVGVVGLGGLGHMALKIARAMGAEVVLFTTSPSKIEDAKKLGAHEVILSKEKDQMKKHANTFDFIIDTVSAPHNLDDYTSLLKRDGTLCLVGAPPTPHHSPNVGHLIGKRRSIAGSLIGGLPETKEMLEFCAKHGFAADIELINIQQINEAYDRMLKNDVKYRFVIDMKSLQTN